MNELPYDDPSFNEAWSEWLEFRKKIKKPYTTSKSINRALNWLKKHNLNVYEAIATIHQSIDNVWIGFWPLKQQNDGQQTTQWSNKPHPPGTSEARINALRNW